MTCNICSYRSHTCTYITSCIHRTYHKPYSNGCHVESEITCQMQTDTLDGNGHLSMAVLSKPSTRRSLFLLLTACLLLRSRIASLPRNVATKLAESARGGKALNKD